VASDAAAFLYRFARMLDERRLSECLELCTDDLSYVVTTAADRAAGSGVALINDDRDRLAGRIASIERYWHAEAPRTHTNHMITNVEADPDGADAIVARSCFTVTAVRRDHRTVLTGRYEDTLRVADGELRLARRLAVLDADLLVDGRVTFII
jgi:3-phenylpropionate/cinnamic acid dioxygenase small subunit